MGFVLNPEEEKLPDFIMFFLLNWKHIAGFSVRFFCLGFSRRVIRCDDCRGTCSSTRRWSSRPLAWVIAFPPYAMIALYSNSEQLCCSMKPGSRKSIVCGVMIYWFSLLDIFYHDSPWLLIVWGLTVLPWGFFSAYCLASYLLTFMWTAPLNECGNPCVSCFERSSDFWIYDGTCVYRSFECKV